MICFIASVDAPAWAKNLSLFTSRHAAQAGMVISVDSRLGRGPMFSKLKAAWARMTGGRAAGESDEPDTPAIAVLRGVRGNPLTWPAQQLRWRGLPCSPHADTPITAGPGPTRAKILS